MNNFITYKIRDFILRKRCSTCFKSFKPENCSIIQSFGLADKKKFVFARPSLLMTNGHRYQSSRIGTAPRGVLTPYKPRILAPIFYVEINCECCGNYKEFEVDMGNIEAI